MKKLLTHPFLLAVIFCALSFVCTESSYCQPSASCSGAPFMNVPDTVPAYCSNFEVGMVRQGVFSYDDTYVSMGQKIAWYKFTVPAGKGIEGCIIDIPLAYRCTTCVGGVSVSIYKGSDCSNLTLVATKAVLEFYDPGYGTNQRGAHNLPAVFDNVLSGETYYLKIEGNIPPEDINPGIKWLPYVAHSYECNNSDTISSLPFRGCNLTDGSYPPVTWNPDNNTPCQNFYLSNIRVNNPVYYTVIPSANNFSVTVKSVDAVMLLYVFKDCAHLGDYTRNAVTNEFEYFYGCSGNSYPYTKEFTISVTNVAIGVPLVLVIDAGWICGDLGVLCPTAGRFDIEATGILLPMSLVNFDASYSKFREQVALSWSLENEPGIETFIIERSDDGIHFYAIGKINRGLSTAYSFYDKKRLTGKTFYRLRMSKKEGKYGYSKIAIVDNAINNSITVYPNPASNQINISLGAAIKGQVQVLLMDVEGKLVFSKKYNVREGTKTISINTAAFPKGAYFVKVKSGDAAADGVNKIVIY